MAKKITTKDFELFDNTASVMIGEIEVTVKRTLTLDEYFGFVHDVVSLCFDPDDGSYQPEVKDYAIRSNIVARYTDITLPTNIDKAYSVLCRTNLVPAILDVIDIGQHSTMLTAIDEQISHRVAMLESTAENTARVIMKQFEDFVQKTESVFGEVSGADMSAAISNLAKVSKTTDTEIVHAMLGRGK